MLLVEAGYEAWIASLRGTIPSQNHTHLDSKNDLEYWDFDFDDIGTKNLPHFVNLILKETGTEKVYFVCHSGGCISYTTGLVEKPELNKKFKAAFYLAPGTFIGSSYNPVLQLWASIIGSPLERILIRVLKGRVDGEQGWLATSLGLTPQSLCSWKYLRCGVCDSLFFALNGNNVMQLNYTELPTILEKLQDTFSLKTLIHAMQNYKNCSLRKYDYGKERNLEKYGSFEPPHYDLERIAVPIYLFYGESDNMVTPDDVRKTRDAIPSRYMHGFYRVEWPSFNHVDFLTAKDADILLYNKILNIMQNLDSES